MLLLGDKNLILLPGWCQAADRFRSTCLTLVEDISSPNVTSNFISYKPYGSYYTDEQVNRNRSAGYYPSGSDYF